MANGDIGRGELRGLSHKTCPGPANNFDLIHDDNKSRLGFQAIGMGTLDPHLVMVPSIVVPEYTLSSARCSYPTPAGNAEYEAAKGTQFTSLKSR